MAEPLPPVEWKAIDNSSVWGFTRNSDEAFNNCAMIYSILSSRGWTLQAISALCGNIEVEGVYNPWSWENQDVLASTDTELIRQSMVHGYGLVGFTPSGKYIYSTYAQAYPGYAPHFSDIAGNPSDGNAQILFIDEHADYSATQAYPLSFSEFKASTASVDYLTAAWIYNYERPGDPTATIAQRREAANYWYQTLLPYDPNPQPTPPTKRKSMPLWMMIRKF